MRIDPNIPSGDSSAANSVNDTRPGAPNAAQVSSAGTSTGAPSDTVEISSGQATVRTLLTQLNQVPDVRQQAVSSLQQQIQSGRYQPTNEQVAGAIVDDLFGAAATA